MRVPVVLAIAAVAALAFTVLVEDASATSLDVCPDCVHTSIQAAVDAASDGDFIRVGPGIYPESVIIDKPVRLIGARAGDAPDEGGGPETVVTGVEGRPAFRVTAPNVTVDGFTLASGGWGLRADAADLRVNHNVFRNNAIDIVLMASRITVEANSFETTSGATRHALLPWGPTEEIVFRSNKAGNNLGETLYLREHPHARVVLENNHFTGSNGLRLDNVSIAEVVDNVFEIDGVYALAVHGESKETIIHGNVFTAYRSEGILVRPTNHPVVLEIRNNTLVGTDESTGLDLVDPGGQAAISGNRFETNRRHVLDRTGGLDLDTVSRDNSFDREVRVEAQERASVHQITSHLSTAAAFAPDGATLMLSPGDYEETLAIYKPLTIRGTPDPQGEEAAPLTRLRAGSPQEPAASILSSGVALADIHLFAAPSGGGVGLALPGFSDANLERLTFSGFQTSLSAEDAIRLRVTDGTFHVPPVPDAHALVLDGGRDHLIQNSTFIGGAGAAVAVTDGTGLTLVGNSAEGGMVLHDAADVRLLNNQVTNHLGPALVLDSDGTSSLLQDNVLVGMPSALRLEGAGDHWLVGNDLSGSAAEGGDGTVHARLSNGTLTMQHNRFHSASGTALDVQGPPTGPSVMVVMEGNRLEGGAGISNVLDLFMGENVVSNSTRPGILVGPGVGRAALLGNSVQGSAGGIQIAGTDGAIVRENVLVANARGDGPGAGTAIHITDASGAIVMDNVLTRHSGFSLRAERSPGLLVESNVLRDAGIRLTASPDARMAHNEISDAQGLALDVAAGSDRTVVEDNVLQGSAGGARLDAGALVVRGNTFRENDAAGTVQSGHGVVAEAGASQLLIDRNVFEGNDVAAVALRGPAMHANVTHNTVNGGSTGIRLEGSGHILLAQNELFADGTSVQGIHGRLTSGDLIVLHNLIDGYGDWAADLEGDGEAAAVHVVLEGNELHGAGARVSHVATASVERNEIEDASTPGLELRSVSQETTVRENRLLRNAGGLALIEVDAAVVEDNHFESNNAPGDLDAAYGLWAISNQGPLVLTQNTFIGHHGGSILLESARDAAVSDNVLEGAGMSFTAVQDSVVTSNRILNASQAALRLGGQVKGLLIEGNELQDGASDAIRLIFSGTLDLLGGGGANTDVRIHQNQIEGNAGAGLFLAPGSYTGMLTAERNWWGAPTGPTVGPLRLLEDAAGLGQAIDGDPVLIALVDFLPWCTAQDCTDDGSPLG